MREILFSGKRKDNGEWVEGFLFQTKEHTYIAYPEQFDDDLFFAPKNIFIEVLPETVGQYTGITDKNGKKIFEGYIVKYTQFEKFSCGDELKEAEEKEGHIGVVSYEEGTFAPLPTRYDCDDYWYSFAADDFEVIGNIHDTPELLKGEE